MENINKTVEKKKKFSTERFSTFSFLTLIPIVALMIFVFISMFGAKVEEVDLPKILIKDLKTMRVAIDDFYKATGTFPDLALANSDEKLEKIYYEKDGEKIYFKDYLKENGLPRTPAFKDLPESNKIHMVENFKKVTDDGGWNYNIKTGEIHVNLPYNFFEQGIDWKNY
ncbi:hypothetical protein [Fusobacterium hwasookii]|uniref:Uncharacterized protein n=1 Tax=Fusobacterium hwasookii ChDC F174 TaxID=1307442 RepID=A0A0S2ZNX0_9FUSO|nr:hypothetical protein [Fusobacterium hwasookii]ALQ37340.1 hypothetical protein RN97_03775 [Fusobacterium hwasookii ChDC F300]ALQ40542.1 hypothetical protein RN87_08370 [Fusobacterium hwasookii ChDC F174]QNE67709.1 hypothetical protein H5V38_07225 [Fusobacterium hwasookii]QYR55104.1 hypothetical protein JY400_00575 [Fusobacterium hwasookii]